ncbi:TetR/AcrR family transcriptional regulator [Bacillus thermotolerans]|uniref:TetR/AcrR family transcriptional regulator n=1 Tax=Bacillus thermotolerans TaxID=1221996 RepID=UPI000588FCE3|nr:TetR/AcrR family transcriptional regulator [Bacillus thermotolerans]KKB44998.1 Transcriptional regulator, TetR family [Bacillus thermotolerans]
MTATRKEIQKARMWRYFLDAAVEVIEEEGIDHVTIRKIADKAGYTSSTAYNYFKDLSRLKFFAAMRFTRGYLEDLPRYMEKGTNTIEKWLYTWECFCKHSFEQPEIYSLIFIEHLETIPEELLDYYYSIYPKELSGLPENIQSIVMEHTFSKRSALYIREAVGEGFVAEEDVDFISDATLLIWKGMMATVMNQQDSYSADEATAKTLYYIYESVLRTVQPEKREEIHFSPEINKERGGDLGI